jgi:hypothetical protein
MRRVGAAVSVLAVLLLLAPAAPAQAELRISDLDVFLNDFEVTVRAVALDALTPGMYEAIQTGIPAHVRFHIELWQFIRGWRDRRLHHMIIERQLTYNVVAKEYRVTFMRGESRPVYATRDLRDAQRVVSEVHSAKLAAASSLDPLGIIYVRVKAEVALNGENTWLTRLAGTAEQAVIQSDYRTLRRIQ